MKARYRVRHVLIVILVAAIAGGGLVVSLTYAYPSADCVAPVNGMSDGGPSGTLMAIEGAGGPGLEVVAGTADYQPESLADRWETTLDWAWVSVNRTMRTGPTGAARWVPSGDPGTYVLLSCETLIRVDRVGQANSAGRVDVHLFQAIGDSWNHVTPVGISPDSVNPLTVNCPYTLVTPASLGSDACGTFFHVTVRPNGDTIVETIRDGHGGWVRVYGSTRNQVVIVREGQRTTIARGGAPTTPCIFSESPTIERWAAMIGQGRVTGEERPAFQTVPTNQACVNPLQ